MRSAVRKTKIALFSVRQWRKRLVFWSGALTIGTIASSFALAVDSTQEIFDKWILPHPALPLLLSPVLFAISAWLTRRYFPNAKGSGIPQVIAARIMRDQENRERLIGMKVALGKIVLTILGVLAGASIGREGPTVQIGAAIMLLCATYGGLRGQRGVALAGAAAGIAAAFNTPMAGIIFAIEEMARSFEHRNSSIILIAIVFAGAASMSILGNYEYFGYTDVDLNIVHDGFGILGIGILGGVIGGVFARMLIDGEGQIRNSFGGFGVKHPIAFAALCGLGVAAIGISSGGLTYGSGYALGHDLLHETLKPEWWMLPAKFFAAFLSSVSGIPGGIFSPSLSVGAALGGMYTLFTNTIPVAGAVLLGMVSYLAGVTQAPITAFVIVLEITGRVVDPVPLIATAALASGISRLISRQSLYHALAHNFLKT